MARPRALISRVRERTQRRTISAASRFDVRHKRSATMSTQSKFERSLLSHDEYQPVGATHHPAIYELSRKELQDVRVRLRQLLDKERTQARQKRRGKSATRGASSPGDVEHATKRKQVFAAALKRANREVSRLEILEARTANIETAQRALALRRAANFQSGPPAGKPASDGMRPLPSRRRTVTVPGARIGSITKATQRAQARRDKRG